MLIVNPKTTIAHAERLLEEISQTSEDDGRLLNIPHTPTHLQCGGLAANIQAILTWGRTRERLPRDITFNFRDFTAGQVEEAVEYLPGLIGALMSSDVVDKDGTSVRPSALLACGRRIDRMTNLPVNKHGPSMSLLCADRTTKRALPAFYHPRSNGGGVLKDETEFVALTATLLDLVVQSIRLRDIAGLEDPLGVLLRELFDNTHRHARTDTTGQQYRQSVRGVFMAHHAAPPQALERVAKGYLPLEHYLADLEELGRGGAHRQLLELSVFDSGPGLAARFLGAPLPADTGADREYEIVTNCFRKNVSTVNRPGGGAGLSRVLLRLKQGGGFLRLRTGRLSLHQNFSRSFGMDADLFDDDLALKDASGGPASLQPWVAGTVLTLMLPLKVVE